MWASQTTSYSYDYLVEVHMCMLYKIECITTHPDFIQPVSVFLMVVWEPGSQIWAGKLTRYTEFKSGIRTAEKVNSVVLSDAVVEHTLQRIKMVYVAR